MEIIIFDKIHIIYNKEDLENIDEIIETLKNNYHRILSFFKIEQLDKPLYITLYNDHLKFQKELKQITKNDIPFWVTGSSKNNKNDDYSRIDYLSLNEIKNIEIHKDETIEELKKGLLHEFVHICHSQSCEYNYPKELFLVEGVATYLSNDYQNPILSEPIEKVLDNKNYVEYENYRYVFDRLIEMFNHDELLNILNNKQKLEQKIIIEYVKNNKKSSDL